MAHVGNNIRLSYMVEKQKTVIQMTYNLTAINASANPLEFMQQMNELSGGVLGNGWSIVFFVILFSMVYLGTRDMRKAMLGSGTVTFFIGFVMLAMKLLDWYMEILYLAVIILGIIMMQDKDRGN